MFKRKSPEESQLFLFRAPRCDNIGVLAHRSQVLDPTLGDDDIVGANGFFVETSQKKAIAGKSRSRIKTAPEERPLVIDIGPKWKLKRKLLI